MILVVISRTLWPYHNNIMIKCHLPDSCQSLLPYNYSYLLEFFELRSNTESNCIPKIYLLSKIIPWWSGLDHGSWGFQRHTFSTNGEASCIRSHTRVHGVCQSCMPIPNKMIWGSISLLGTLWSLWLNRCFVVFQNWPRFELKIAMGTYSAGVILVIWWISSIVQIYMFKDYK